MRPSLLAIILACSLSASGQAYEYAKLLGSVAGDARGQGVMTGPGGFYTKGVFNGALKIGPAYYRAEHSDAFLMKHDGDGNYLWFKKVGFKRVESTLDGDGAITNDYENSIFIIGTFQGTTTIEGQSLTNLGSGDVYVIKYDQNGNFQWARSIGGALNDTGNAITTDAAGNIYIGGTTRSVTMDFGGAPVSTGVTGSSTRAAFFAKLDTEGADNWIQFKTTPFEQNELHALHHDGTRLFAGGEVNGKAWIGRFNDGNGTTVWDSEPMGTIQSASSTMRSIVSNNGKLYTAGEFGGADIRFGALPLLLNQGDRDMFLAAFDLNGTPLFSDAYGSTGNDAILAQDFSDYDGDEMVFAAGYYGGALTIGSTDLPVPSGTTGAVAIRFNVEDDEYNADSEMPVLTGGTGRWLGITEANDYEMYLTGFYRGAIDMAGDHFNQVTSTFMVTKYDYNHNELFSLTSHKGYITANQLKVDASGFVYLAGEYRGTVDLYGHLIVSSETTANNTDLFIAKMQPDGTVVWVTTVETQDFETMHDLTVDGAGNVYFIAHFYYNPTIAGVLVSPVEAERLLVKLSSNGSYVYSHYIDGTGGDVTSIEGDADGNGVFVAGTFDSEFDFQGYNFGSNGDYDIFLMKLDDEGDLVSPAHIKQFGGAGADHVTDLHHEAGMNLAMTGYTNGAIDFGTSNVIANADGFNDVYWVRFDGTFNDVVPARLDGGLGEQRSEKITFDAAGNISIAGVFEGTADFSGAAMSGGTNSMFLASYNPTAVLRGAQSILHSSVDGASTITSIAADQPGNIYLAGILNTGTGSLDFGGTTLVDAGESDAYIAHYDINTELVVAVRYGSPYISGEFTLGVEGALAIDVCPMNEVWLTGVVAEGTASFGPFSLKPYGLVDGDNSDGVDSYLVNIDFLNPFVPEPKMYWTEEDGNQINRANTDGTFFEQYYTGFSIFPQGIAYDNVNDYIFWTDTNGKVRKGKIGPSAFTYYQDVIDEHTTNARENLGVALDLTAGKVYWVSAWDNSIKSAQFDAPVPISTVQTPITGLEAPSAVAVDPVAGKIYYSDTQFQSGTTYEATIHSANLDGSGDEIVYSESRTYYEIYFPDIKLDLPEGKIYWSMVDYEAGHGRIYSAYLTDIAGTVTSFDTPGYTNGIDIDRGNGKIYWVDKEIVSAEPTRLMRSSLDGTDPEVLRQGAGDNLYKPNFIALGLTPAAPPPTTFKSIYPEIGHQGEKVLITGTSFGAISGPIDFNGTTVTDQEGVNAQNLIVKIPPGPIASGPVHVDVATVAVSSAQHFTPASFSDGKASEWLQITGVPSLALAGAGDVDNDGVSDFVIGNYLAGGDDYGGTTVITLNANKTVKGSTTYVSSIEGERFGFSLSTIGDFNGDGFPDHASGAIGSDDGGSDHGKIYFQDAGLNILGSFSDASGVLAGALSDAGQFGFSTALLGDVHANGVMDLAVSANRDAGGGTERGAVYVLFMQNGGSVQSYVKIGQSSGGFTGTLSNNDRFGSAICNIGDIDGNGTPDLAVSAVGDDVGAGDAGAVYILLLNADGTVSSHRKITDETSGFTGNLDGSDSFGFALSSAGDLDRDGIGDLLVGAPGDDDGGLNRGAVYVLTLNANGTVKQTMKLSNAVGNSFEGVLADNAQFGRSIALVGDPDHDGYRDFAIGATAPNSVWIVELGTNEIALYDGATAASPSILSGQTAPVDFLNAAQGTNIDRVLSIQNSGNAKLRISSINITGTAFSIVGSPPIEVLAGGLVNLTVRLSGSSAGIFNETITIVNDDADETSFNFPLSGQILTCSNPPTANAGPSQSVCQGNLANLSGTVQFVSTYSWSTSGTGTFNNNSILTPIYTPSPGDIAGGLATLTLTANDPDGAGPCVAASSQMVLTINSSGSVNAGADVVMCPSSTVNLNGAVTGTLLNPVWTTSGDGTFGNSSALSTTYSPGPGEIATGSVSTITLSGTGVGVCPAASDALTFVVVRPPVAADLALNATIGQVSLADVIAASTIPTGSITQVTITQEGTKGAVTVRSDKQIEYSAFDGTVGPDVIQYRICNQCSQCDDGQINITVLNVAPVYAAQPTVEAVIGSTAIVQLATHLFDANNNLDLGTLTIVGTLSQATATVDASSNVQVDYSSGAFVGTDQITLRVCDVLGACLQFVVAIQVTGEIDVYNGISPNGDGDNDFWRIGNIQFIEPNNKVSLFNRWGDAVYEADNYNNTTVKFDGLGKNGKTVSSGTYFYKIEFPSGREQMTGYLTIKN